MRKNAVNRMGQSDLTTKRVIQKSCPIDDSEDSSDVGPDEFSNKYKAKEVEYVDDGYLEDSEEDEAYNLESTDSSNTNAESSNNNSDKESENRIIAELGYPFPSLSEKAPTLNSNFQSFLATDNTATGFPPSPSAPPLSLAGSRMLNEGDRRYHNENMDLTIDENEADLNIKEIFFIALQSVLYEHVLQPSSYSSPTAKMARYIYIYV
jgi:hypothetical protein